VCPVFYLFALLSRNASYSGKKLLSENNLKAVSSTNFSGFYNILQISFSLRKIKPEQFQQVEKQNGSGCFL
jgi:hypothetical protein